MSTTVKDLFNVLTDDIWKVVVSNKGRHINYYYSKCSSYHYVFNPFDYLEDGTYYREGHEPKRVPLTAEDLKERAIECKCMYLDDNQLVIDWTNDEVKLSNAMEFVSYQELADNYIWLDGTPCSKEG